MMYLALFGLADSIGMMYLALFGLAGSIEMMYLALFGLAVALVGVFGLLAHQVTDCNQNCNQGRNCTCRGK